MKSNLLMITAMIALSFTLNAQLNRRVVLVIIDGARYSETLGDPAGTYIPRMKALASQGVVVDTMLNDSVTFTKRAIPAIWCGSWSAPKDTTVNGVSNQYATVPTVWEYFRKSRGTDSTHAMYIMKMLSSPWIQSYFPGYGPGFWPWYILQGSTDTQVWINAQSKLLTYHPELVVIYLPDVDSAPAKGWTAYTRAIVTADSIVGALWDLLQNDPVYQNTTTLFVTNDHGRHLDGTLSGFVSHGDGCMGCRHIMFFAVGAGVAQGKHTSIRRTIPDIVPTIGTLLQFPTPHATGKIMAELFTQTGEIGESRLFPVSMTLEQNFPNPFNPSTTIRYALSSSAHVRLTVYNLLGQVVSELVNEEQSAGWKDVQWNSAHAGSGMYFFTIHAGTFKETKRMMLMK